MFGQMPKGANTIIQGTFFTVTNLKAENTWHFCMMSGYNLQLDCWLFSKCYFLICHHYKKFCFGHLLYNHRSVYNVGKYLHPLHFRFFFWPVIGTTLNMLNFPLVPACILSRDIWIECPNTWDWHVLDFFPMISKQNCCCSFSEIRS